LWNRFAGLSVTTASAAEGRGRTKRHEYCYACYTGDYPTELVNIEELIAARTEEAVRDGFKPLEKLQRDDLATAQETVPVHDWQERELARRKANLLKNPASGLSWKT